MNEEGVEVEVEDKGDDAGGVDGELKGVIGVLGLVLYGFCLRLILSNLYLKSDRWPLAWPMAGTLVIWIGDRRLTDELLPRINTASVEIITIGIWAGPIRLDVYHS